MPKDFKNLTLCSNVLAGLRRFIAVLYRERMAENYAIKMFSRTSRFLKCYFISLIKNSSIDSIKKIQKHKALSSCWLC